MEVRTIDLRADLRVRHLLRRAAGRSAGCRPWP